MAYGEITLCLLVLVDCVLDPLMSNTWPNSALVTTCILPGQPHQSSLFPRRISGVAELSSAALLLRKWNTIMQTRAMLCMLWS